MKKNKVITLAVIAALAVGVSAPADRIVQTAKKPKLAQKEITLKKGKSKTLKVKNKTKKAKITWSSKNKKVAVVSRKGKVTGKGKGITKIVCKVKAGRKKYTLTCKVIVETLIPPDVIPTPDITPMPAPTQTPTPTAIATDTPTLVPTPTVTPEKAEEKKSLQVEGVAKTKNGNILKNTSIMIYDYSTVSFVRVVTDEEGKYTVSLSAGTYHVEATEIGRMENITISNNGNNVIHQDLVTVDNFYWLRIKAVSANHIVLANQSFTLNNEETIYSDENGVIQKFCCVKEGEELIRLMYLDNSSVAAEISVTKDIGTEEKPEEVIFSADFYELSVLTDKQQMECEEEALEIILQKNDERYSFRQSDVKNVYRGYVPEGEYKVRACSYVDEDERAKSYFLGNLKISEDMTFDATKLTFHKLRFKADQLEDAQDLKLDGWSLDPEYENYYTVPMTGRLTGNSIGYQRDADGEIEKVTGFYDIDQEITVEETSPERVMVNLVKTQHNLSELQVGTATTSSIQVLQENKWNSYFKFVPKTDGTYTFSTDFGTFQEAMKIFSVGMNVYDDTMDYLDGTEPYWQAGFLENKDLALKASMQCNLKAGRTYYIVISPYIRNKQNLPVTIEVKKL